MSESSVSDNTNNEEDDFLDLEVSSDEMNDFMENINTEVDNRFDLEGLSDKMDISTSIINSEEDNDPALEASLNEKMDVSTIYETETVSLSDQSNGQQNLYDQEMIGIYFSLILF